MELLGPAAPGVEAAEEKHHIPEPLGGLLGRGGATGAGLGEDRRGLGLGAVGVGQVLQAVVRQASAERVEKRVALVERREQRRQVADRRLGARRQLFAPGVENLRRGDGHELVRAVGGIDAGLQPRLRDGDVVLERVRRIVGGADHGDLVGGEDAVGGEGRRGQFRVGELPDLGRVGLVDGQVDAEETAQLEMRPVVEGVAHQLRHHAAVGEELVVVGGGRAGDEVLVHARRAQGPPLVVVARQPHLGEVGEAPVRRDLVGRQVAVVVVDRPVLRDLVVKAARGRGGEQKIVVEEGGHGRKRDEG